MAATVIPGKSFNRSKRHLRLVQSRAEPSLLPRTRGECEGGPRPCPLVSCSQNLCTETTFAGGIRINWLPEDEPERPNCALDAADLNGLTRTEVATLLGVSLERVRQLEERGLRKMRGPMRKANEP